MFFPFALSTPLEKSNWPLNDPANPVTPSLLNPTCHQGGKQPPAHDEPHLSSPNPKKFDSHAVWRAVKDAPSPDLTQGLTQPITGGGVAGLREVQTKAPSQQMTESEE